ncbi:MAG: glycerol-3-phosphate 1-O-acyltransferase PlsB [Glaciecola sp.]|jgi:glycerol-3-phosphate O-acyltransferase
MSFFKKCLISLLYWPIRILVKPHTIPADVSGELGIEPTKPIIYLLHTDSIADQLALAYSTKKLGLPSPLSPVKLKDSQHPSCLYLYSPTPIFSKTPPKTKIEMQFTALFHTHRAQPDLDIQIVPVYITWGRAPEKSKPGFSDLIVDVASPSWLRKLFIVLFLGRDNFVSYSRSVSSQFMAQQHGDDNKIARKLLRVAATHFQRKRQGLIGPTLLERQTLHSAVIGSNSVKLAMRDLVRTKNVLPEKAKQDAHQYLDEIAADYREGLVRFANRILTPIWNKIYNGISVSNAAKVRELARNGHEIIYVPCHRSHMDYLLLTYVIYHEGLVTPHIAAGINLNFWPAGPIFRRAGAFFLRRSFAGNKVYTAVFREYLELLFNKGYSVKYYPEGGRSRTGRLLPPKTGMLAMTVQAMTKGINRPVSIVPVYIGYENVMEVSSYVKELKGKSKKKESPLQVLGAIKKLRNYGHGYLNFGEPIQLNKFLDQHAPEWSNNIDADDLTKKPQWLTPAVNCLADNIMLEINKSAALNGMAMVSLCLLASKTMTMSQTEIEQSINDYLMLFKALPFSDTMSIPAYSAPELVNDVLALKRLEVKKDKYGSLVSPFAGKAVALTYYRNNIIHLFALPSLITALVFSKNGCEKSHIMTTVKTIYPLLRNELFIYFTLEEALTYTEACITQLKAQGLLIQSGRKIVPPSASTPHFHSAWLLSRVMQDTWQRYAVVLTVLGSNKGVSRGELERESRKIAERLSNLYGVSSPEFSDKNVFAMLVNSLRENDLLESDESGSLHLNDNSTALHDLVNEIVWPEIVQHLQKI